MRHVRPEQGVYGISVAAHLAGMGVQRLRLYESRGLLVPDRTAGGTRRYSQDDLDRLQRIDTLLEAGLNLAGIAMVLDLQDENHRLHHRLDQRRDPGNEDKHSHPRAGRHGANRTGGSTMTQTHREGIDPDILTLVPEADAAEQAIPAVPGDETLEAVEPPPAVNEADPADAWDQSLAMPDLDDDYDYGDRDR